MPKWFNFKLNDSNAPILFFLALLTFLAGVFFFITAFSFYTSYISMRDNMLRLYYDIVSPTFKDTMRRDLIRAWAYGLLSATLCGFSVITIIQAVRQQHMS